MNVESIEYTVYSDHGSVFCVQFDGGIEKCRQSSGLLVEHAWALPRPVSSPENRFKPYTVETCESCGLNRITTFEHEAAVPS